MIRSAAVLMMLVGCLVADSAGAPGGPATRTVLFAGVRLRVPISWTIVEPTFATAAVVQPLGWITNQRPGKQCTDAGCGAPVRALDAGGVLISGHEALDPHPTPFASRRRADPGCPIGATIREQRRVVVDAEHVVQVDACFAAGARPDSLRGIIRG